MKCTSIKEASQCSSLCCNRESLCARTQSECVIYSESHCFRLNCESCCMLQSGNHACGTYIQCGKYFDLFYLWCLLVLAVLLFVLLIIKLRSKFMTVRLKQIQKAMKQFNEEQKTATL